jgi:CRP-like cAMP-binding protein
MLYNSTWADDFSLQDIGEFARYLMLRHFPKDFLIFGEGEQEAYMGIILKGSVEITKRDASPSPKSKRLVLMGPGRAFGELALVDGCPRSASAKAREDVTFAALTREHYDKLCLENKTLALKVSKIVARLISFRLRKASEKLIEFL